jgi:hypothetical protein
MSGGRLMLLLALAAGALALSALFAARLPKTLSVPEGRPGSTALPSPGPTVRPRGDNRRTRGDSRAAGRPRRPVGADAPAPRPPADPSGPRVLGLALPVLIGLELVAGALVLGALAAALTVGRTRRRRRRSYALYELHLSPHDEAKPQDLEDMIEAIANIVRVFPAERARTGQPFVALELLHGAGPSGAMEWSICLRCEPRSAVALDAAISAAYPDVRLGHVLGATPQPRPGLFRVPGCVMRFRKERSFVYPLVAAGDELSSPPLEVVAHTQVATRAPSVVRFQLTPAPAFFEELARRIYRRHENRLVRQERWGLPEGGLTSTLNRAEMANAERTQNRSLFWLEITVAAATRETCKQLAAAVQARRGENRLHRRWMIVRGNLYRRRFATATPPLLPSPRSLVSAAEAAHLLELPSARMKGVPVRRIAIPRIPMPPEILRASPHTPVAAPPERELPAPPATARRVLEVS